MPEVIVECPNTCPNRGVEEGNFSISGDDEIDGYFMSLQLLLSRARHTADDLRQASARAAALGIDGKLPEATQRKLTDQFALEGSLSVEAGAASCSIRGVGLQAFAELAACECRESQGAVACDEACDGVLEAPGSSAFEAQALALRGAAELECRTTAVSWRSNTTDATPRAELEAFQAVAGAELAVGFAALERATRLLAALAGAGAFAQAHGFESRVDEKTDEALELPPADEMRRVMGLNCALAELIRVRKVTDEGATGLRAAIAEWARVSDTLTPR